MNNIEFQCESCEATLSVELTEAGTLVECPDCGTMNTAPASGLSEGSIIGDFKLEKLLGKGGMGEVWLARQQSLLRNIALKILSPSLSEDGEFVKRFVKEVQIAGKLTHPNIVMAYGAGSKDSILYLAVSYVEGRSLGDILHERTLDEAVALKIVREMGEALKYAWTKFKMIHRDIKPDNIMISSAGTAHLMDMGISKLLGDDASLTMTGSILGTPNYISPDQAMGRSLDFRSDIYSLGATLYHCLTGSIPFPAEAPMEILAKHLQEAPPDCRVLNPAVSEATSLLIKKMMAKKPGERHSSWDELLLEIDAITGSMEGACRDTRGDWKNPFPRRSLLLALAGIAVCAFLILAVTLSDSNRRSRSENVQLFQNSSGESEVGDSQSSASNDAVSTPNSTNAAEAPPPVGATDTQNK
ncbi:MAG: protein kinase, partial [Kiritimatiellaeota bacterium]|nr:protein kinase [Kiritimatiellota bacterium]